MSGMHPTGIWVAEVALVQKGDVRAVVIKCKAAKIGISLRVFLDYDTTIIIEF